VGIEDLLDDISAEEARAASEAMADIEFESEVQTRLPEDLRYGGLYGLMSYLGMQGQGDQEGSQGRRAVIKPMGMPKPGKPQVMSNLLGQYSFPESTRNQLKRGVLNGLGLDFYQGTYPKADEIRYFQSTDPELRERGGADYQGVEGYGGFGGLDDLSKTINHELVHRAQSLPLFEDRLKELDLEMQGMNQDSIEGRIEHSKLDKERAYLSDFVKNSHFYLDALDAKYPNTPEERKTKAEEEEIYGRSPLGGDEMVLRIFEDLQDNTRRYLTPERQEELGVRLPIPAAKPKTPSLIEKLENYAKDIF